MTKFEIAVLNAEQKGRIDAAVEYGQRLDDGIPYRAVNHYRGQLRAAYERGYASF